MIRKGVLKFGLSSDKNIIKIIEKVFTHLQLTIFFDNLYIVNVKTYFLY